MASEFEIINIIGLYALLVCMYVCIVPCTLKIKRSMIYDVNTYVTGTGFSARVPPISVHRLRLFVPTYTLECNRSFVNNASSYCARLHFHCSTS